MSIAILATGDEIITGDTLNTNGHELAHRLASDGLSPGLQLACGDEEQEIISCLEFLSKHKDTVIIIGGLGPTSDDRTRFALARFLQRKLIEHKEAIQHIERILSRANLTMNTGNRQQALFPPATVLLPNPFGTAMGGISQANQKTFILLPGPPRECLPMFEQFVLPELLKNKSKGKVLLKWRLFGVAESAVAQMLEEAISTVDCEVGYRLDVPYVEFKVRCHQQQVSEIKARIDPLVTDFIIAPPEYRASELLRQRIAELNDTIEIIDDATGGRLQTALQRQDNFHKLTFHERESRLHFYISGLQEYWENITSSNTQLTIKYQNDGQQGSETHEIPYRSPLVLEYATEWLCFRLLHLINQLH
ncbi:competence/damage-inducible protein A [Legionella impletisoli]|uniref:Competence protein n=1 Tax=Legionella impletisoli TaxID=343510 RepID=A0A917JST1_9GAMM|nr:molybdopterin-binding protein [Legionella impletisoli]GGI85238.1 competence protein [Legionella impletisoli]